MRTCLLITWSLLLLAGGAAHAAACGNTEQDRLVFARERMYPGANTEQLRLVYQWLKNATSSCPLSGDLWYYRSLLAEHFADMGDKEYALRKAGENNSAALTKYWNPLAPVRRASTSSSSAPREKYALLVGVQDMALSEDLLQFADRDASSLKKLLVSSGGFKNDNVTVLVGKLATTQGIREAFGKIREQAKSNDLVVVYFSSHGSRRNLDPIGLSYVLTYDTDTSSAPKLFATALQMVELAELGRWVNAKDYVLLLDTCYSGVAGLGNAGGGAKSEDDLDALQGLQGSGNRVVISASRADEVSYEDQVSRHGYFTHFLLEAMGQNPPPATIKAVYDYVQTHVSTEVAHTPGRQQHPVMRSFGGGEGILLGTPASQTLLKDGEGKAIAIDLPRPFSH